MQYDPRWILNNEQLGEISQVSPRVLSKTFNHVLENLVGIPHEQQEEHIIDFMTDVLLCDPFVLSIIIETPEYQAIRRYPPDEYVCRSSDVEQIRHHVRFDLADGGHFNQSDQNTP